MIDKLSSRIGEDRISVIYHYCNFQNRKSQVTARILASLLKQVVSRLEVIPVEIDRVFQEANQGCGARGLLVSEICKLLLAALRSQKRTFICIDALDECATKHRPEFLRSLHSVVRSSPNVRLFLTGRPHIQAQLEEYHSRALRIVLFKPVKRDIRIYLEMKLQDDPFPDAMDNGLEKGIMEVIPEMMSEM